MLLPVIREHHEHVCDTLDPSEETDPCHQSIHHQVAAGRCDHKAHVSEPTDECSLCSLLAYCPFQPVVVSDMLASVTPSATGVDTDDTEVIFIASRWIQIDARGPPFLS